jgi:general nucleoside transport system permease protein
MTGRSMSGRAILQTVWPVVPLIMALVLITIMLLLISQHSPLAVYRALWQGAFKDAGSTFNTLAFWIPLLLCATGLLVTFTGGLWNIGVEGQMIMGAIGASWVALKIAAPYPDLPPLIIITLEIIVAMVAGGLWAALAAVLKTRGGVHEIFGGVALNSLAIIATNYLISSPWQPPGGGSFHGTEEFTDNAHARSRRYTFQRACFCSCPDRAWRCDSHAARHALGSSAKGAGQESACRISTRRIQ